MMLCIAFVPDFTMVFVSLCGCGGGFAVVYATRRINLVSVNQWASMSNWLSRSVAGQWPTMLSDAVATCTVCTRWVKKTPPSFCHNFIK